MSPTVTSDIEALCGKCGQSWHVVVAMMGDRVAKVECKRCGAQHRYRDPEPKNGGTKTAKTGAKTSGKSKSKTSPLGRARRPSRAVKIMVPDPSLPSRPYHMSEQFAVGEQLEHPRFGIGVVEQEVGQGKIQVVFTDGKRVMVHAK